MYVAQKCSSRCDDAIEHEILAGWVSRGLIGIDLHWETATDAATVLKFH